MIANRGAIAEALERWNERRRRIFYPKTDLDFDLAAVRQRRLDLGKADLTKLSSVLDEEVRSVEFLPNAGTFHALFRIATSGGNYFLKLAPEEPAFGFSIESWAMGKLKSLGLPNLQTPAYSALADSFSAPFLVIEEAKGQPLNRFEDAETQAMPQPLLFELGRLLRRVHSVEAEGAGLIDVASLGEKPRGLHSNWEDYVMLQLDAHLEICERIGAITQERTRIEKLFVEASPMLNRAPIRWLHGDPGHHNVFSEGQGITAILDWEDSLCGDPIFDVAYWGTFVRDEMRDEFLRGYMTLEILPGDFERRYWLYYLRVAISKTVHRHLFGVKDRPGRPPASRRIQKALSKISAL
jgi:aminoglycoside phosphotransferase (APT) family kinase protein